MATDCEVFLSFKDLDKERRPTRDRALAREVYEYLSQGGLQVFNCDISLEEVGASNFKKAVDEALDQARVVAVIGASLGNIDSEWVGYEWRSFHNDILNGTKPHGHLFAYVEGIDPRTLPRGLREQQCITHTGNDSLAQLYKFIINSRGKPSPEPLSGNDPPARPRPLPFKIRYAGLAIALAASAIITMLLWWMTSGQGRAECRVAITSPANNGAAPIANDVDAPGNFIAVSGRTRGCPSDHVLLMTAQLISDPQSPELPQFAGAPIRPSTDGSWSAYIHVGGPDAESRFRVRAYSISEQTLERIKEIGALPPDMVKAEAEVVFTVVEAPPRSNQ